MSGEPPKGRGRARGRARAAAPPTAQQAPQPPSARSAPQSTALSSGSSTQQRPIGRSGARGLAVASVSDIASKTQALSISSGGNGGGDGNGNGGNGNGNGNGNGAPIGRGNVRGGRFLDTAGPLITRPEHVLDKRGMSGVKRRVQTNYFQLFDTKKWVLYKHHVDFNPPEDRTFLRRVWVREHSQKFGGVGFVFDGSTLFSTQPLCPENKPLVLTSVRKSDEVKIQITMKRVGTCEAIDYQSTQVFNIILRKCLDSLKLQEIRRNYYDPAARIMIPEYNLELWPGYISSIAQHEKDILMLAEINYKVLRTDTAYQLFKDTFQRVGPHDGKRQFSLSIIGSVVLTTYNNKTYRVDDVDYTSTPKNTFQKKTREGIENIEYASYFQKHYGAKITDMGQPMLVSRSNARALRAGQSELVYLVPELCVLTGLTDEMRSNYQLMRATAMHTAVGPGDRVKRIVSYGNRLLAEPQVRQTFSEWGMKMVPQLVEVDARVLPTETITVGGGKTYSAGPNVDWTRNLRENLLLNAVECTSWIMVYPYKFEQEAQQLFNELNKVGRPMGFRMSVPVKAGLPNDSVSAYVLETEKAINNNNPQFVLFLFPNNRSDRYAAVKKKCILEHPVPSQVVLLKSVRNKTFTSIATKIAIQINCKLGGSPWTLDIPITGLMIVGYDVCHDPRDKRKSYGGMVATYDKSFTRYWSSVKHHSGGEELSPNFGLSLSMAAKHYRQVNGELPKKIIVFRDGVGEGSIRYVKEQEVINIRKQLAELYLQEPIQMAFVLVTKRINTRVFDNGKNPVPGTVVDDVVTNPSRYDFYLVSQSVRQGTVSPTYYNVIDDSIHLKPDIMQRLTYRLTHMYFNWSGTVCVPAPCQYAHKLAFLTSQSVGADHSNLSHLLYFL